MIILYSLLIVLLFFVFFITTYFFIEKIKEIIVYKTLKRLSVFKNIIEGFVYGGLLIVYSMFSHIIYEDFNIMMFIVPSIVLLLIRNIGVASYSTLAALIYTIFTSDVGTITYIILFIYFLFMVLLIFWKFFSAKRDFIFFVYLIIIITALIGIIIAVFGFKYSFNWVLISQILFTVLASMIIEILVNISIRMSISANILYEYSNYKYLRFYKSSLTISMISQNIKENKIKKGIYGIFKIDFPNQKTKELNKEMNEAILNEIQKQFHNDYTLFNIDTDNYGFFVKWDKPLNLIQSMQNNTKDERPIDDSLSELEFLFKKISNIFVLSNGEKVQANIMASIAIYGLQSSSIHELENWTLFSKQYLSKNKIILFDSREYKKRISDLMKVEELNKVLNFDDLSLVYYPVYNIQNGFIFNYSEFTNSSEDFIIRSPSNFAYESGVFESYNRYLALEAIGNNQGSTAIAVAYSWNLLNKNFDIRKFVNRIKTMKMEPTNLTLIFDSKEINCNQTRLNNIEKLKKYGFLIGIINPTLDQENIIFSIQPNYVFLERMTMKSLIIKNKTILLNINLENELHFAHKKGITMFSGHLFGIFNKPKVENINIINIRDILKKGINE